MSGYKLWESVASCFAFGHFPEAQVPGPRSTSEQEAGNSVLKASKRTRILSMLMVVLIVVMAASVTSLAAQPTVNLGTSENFAVLAGTTITNTGSTKINGDVGLYPGTAFPGQADVTLNGALHLNDGVASKAKDDLVTAYDDAAGRTPVTRVPTQLGGTTLKPGVYDSAAGTFQITGTLTLDDEGDPDGVFVFLTGSTLITAPDSRVNIINGARFCRIFWKVGSSATLGTSSHFVGHIFALTSIAAKTGATIQGQLLARDGSVTLDSNTITNGECTAAPTPTPTSTSTPTSSPTPSATTAATPSATTAATPTAPATAATTVSAGTPTSVPASNLPASSDIPRTGEGGSGTLPIIGIVLLALGGLSLALVNRSRKRMEPIAVQSDSKKDKE